MSNLSDAIADLKREPNALEAIAADYEISPELLKRKAAESCNPVELQTEADILEKKVRKICKRYNVPYAATQIMKWKGKTYTAICTLPTRKNRAVAIDHSEFKAWTLPANELR